MTTLRSTRPPGRAALFPPDLLRVRPSGGGGAPQVAVEPAAARPAARPRPLGWSLGRLAEFASLITAFSFLLAIWANQLVF